MAMEEIEDGEYLKLVSICFAGIPAFLEGLDLRFLGQVFWSWRLGKQNEWGGSLEKKI